MIQLSKIVVSQQLLKMCTVFQVCLQNHLKQGFFLKQYAQRLIFVLVQSLRQKKLTIVYFHSAFSFQSAFNFHGSFILFMTLYFSCIAPFCSCIALYSNFLCESALVYFLQLESARYFTFLPNCHAAIISICEALYLLISERDF